MPAWVSVFVRGQDRRLVYIDGQYDDPAGVKAPGPFDVRPGKHTFETLNRQSCVDNRAQVNAKSGQDEVEAEFEDVDPPEPIE